VAENASGTLHELSRANPPAAETVDGAVVERIATLEDEVAQLRTRMASLEDKLTQLTG
jgi:uncharacterized protein YceH (UPF0502 family)